MRETRGGTAKLRNADLDSVQELYRRIAEQIWTSRLLRVEVES